MWTVLAILVGLLFVACEQSDCMPSLMHNGRQVYFQDTEAGRVYFQPGVRGEGLEDWCTVTILERTDDYCGFVEVSVEECDPT